MATTRNRNGFIAGAERVSKYVEGGSGNSAGATQRIKTFTSAITPESEAAKMRSAAGSGVGSARVGPKNRVSRYSGDGINTYQPTLSTTSF